MKNLFLLACMAACLVVATPTTAQISKADAITAADTLGDAQDKVFNKPYPWYGTPYDFYDDYEHPWYKGMHLPGLPK